MSGAWTGQEAYRPEIDGLRALAVLAVIANHFDSRFLAGGYLGVDIFFVISGYVITGSLYARTGASFGQLVSGFYERRVKRLLPALVACVAGTSLVISLFNPNPVVSLKTGIAALFGVSNLVLLGQSTDYFGISGQANAFTHTWSLGVEEQYYLLFPLLLWLTGLGRRVSGLRRFTIVIGLLSVASFASFACLGGAIEPEAFYLMPTRFWELGVGCLVFAALKSRYAPGLLLSRAFSPLPLLAATMITLAWPGDTAVAGEFAVVMLTALLIGSLTPGRAGYRLLTHAASTYVGRISYSLYLWHWSVIAVSHWTIGIHWWSIPLQFVLMLCLAHWSYRHLEKPLRHANWSSQPWRTLAYGLGAAVATAATLVILAKPLRGLLYTGEQPNLAAVGGRTLTSAYSTPGGSSSWQGEMCVLSDNDQVGKTIPIEGCTLGDFSSARRRILVLGNSFSTAFVQAFDELVASNGYAVTITSSWGASPVAGVRNDGAWDEASAYYWEAVAPSLISRLRPGDWVFLINDLARYSPRRRSAEADAQLGELEAGLSRLSQRLAGGGIRLAVLHGLPFAREAGCEPASAVPQWFAPAGGPCQYLSREETLSRRAELDAMLAALEARGAIRIIDLMPVFCPAEVCTYRAANGQLLYRDSYSHPSVEAVRMSGPVIRAVMTAPD